MTTWFLSGPITGHKDYRKKFKEAQQKLEALGYSVINPAELCTVLPEASSWEDYMKICIDLIQMADGVCQLPGWEESRGANREYGFAYATDKWVLPIEELLKEVSA